MTQTHGRHIHLDCVGGAAGDMFVAAMLDAFPDLVEPVLADVAMILPREAGAARMSDVRSGGIRAKHFALHPGDRQTQGGYDVFRQRLETIPLSQGTADVALAILTLLGRAEAEVHGIALSEVHFHELADWDTLMDVTAAGSIIAALSGCSWSVSSLPLGGGRVRTAHGLLAVPAPATLALLKGFEWHDDGVGGERVTPTGGAILSFLARYGGGAHGGGKLVAAGHGAGTRTLDGMANVLRASCFSRAGQQRDRITQLCFEIDDMSGEEIALAADMLRAGPGVRDVVLLAAQGKKGRPVTRFELLVDPDHAEDTITRAFLETSTLGLRSQAIERRVLTRHSEPASEGVRRKSALRPGGKSTCKAESDDLSRIETLAARRARAREIETR